MKSIYDTYTLNNGVKIPCVAYGTYKAKDENGADIISAAVEEGYRYFDTASYYETEEYVAEAIRRSGFPREDFFIATKLWKEQMGYEAALEAFEKSLKCLNTDYIDLYLIHWPKPTPDYKDWKQLDLDTWRALEMLYKEGKVRAIGVSNFLPHHLDNILKHCEIKPMVDQIEYHAGYTQEATVQYCKQHDILVQAWSPISRGRIFHDVTLVELQAAITTLNQADTIKEKAPANQQLTAAAERMNLLLEEYPLSSTDDRYRQQIRTDLASCNQTISHNDYNQMAMAYNNDVLGKFPANVLKRVALVPELELFN